MNINLESLDYGVFYFVNPYNNKVTEIHNQRGYANTTITEYSVNNSGRIFESIKTIKRIDISLNTVVKIDGIQADCEQFHSIQNAYYRQNERF